LILGGAIVTVRAGVASTILLSMAAALAWPAASLAQIDYSGGAGTYSMAAQHGNAGSIGATSNDDSGPTAQQSYQTGLEALKAGNLPKAERAFNNAVFADRKNATYLAMRGVARSRQDDLEAAAKDLEQALKIDPTEVVALREYGIVLAKQGKAENAKAELARLKLQADDCGDTCPDAAKLKEAATAVQDAIAQGASAPGAHS
jgi:Flp pilus assembly protein TadD